MYKKFPWNCAALTICNTVLCYKSCFSPIHTLYALNQFGGFKQNDKHQVYVDGRVQCTRNGTAYFWFNVRDVHTCAEKMGHWINFGLKNITGGQFVLGGSWNNVGPKLCSGGWCTNDIQEKYNRQNSENKFWAITLDWTVITLHYWASALCITVHTGQWCGGGQSCWLCTHTCLWTIICSCTNPDSEG